MEGILPTNLPEVSSLGEFLRLPMKQAVALACKKRNEGWTEDKCRDMLTNWWRYNMTKKPLILGAEKHSPDLSAEEVGDIISS